MSRDVTLLNNESLRVLRAALNWTWEEWVTGRDLHAVALDGLAGQLDEAERACAAERRGRLECTAAFAEVEKAAERYRRAMNAQLVLREAAEAQREIYREALERIAEGSDYTWGNIARLALEEVGE